MVLYLVTMVTMLVSGGNALGCYNDVYLDNVTGHTYTIEHDIADIVTGIGSTGKDEEGFWRTRQFSYISLGHFTDDLESGDGTTITGGYYTADGGLIYKTVVDCDAMKWYNYVTDQTTEAVTEIENGDLETACVAGDDYDMWMKVEQPQIMWFSYQAQVLQTGTREVIVGEWPGYPKTVKSKINSLYDGDEASYFTITTTGSAVVTRFAFGKCFIWPESVGKNCTDTNTWLLDRSKNYGIRGVQEARNTVKCVDAPFQQYFKYRQEQVHPDRGGKYHRCCCTDMTTGHIYNDDPETYCGGMIPTCALGCTETYDHDIYDALTAYNSAEEVAAEEVAVEAVAEEEVEEEV